MYVSSFAGMGALNCPGDPGCPGYVQPDSADYQKSLLERILANQVELANPPANPPESIVPLQTVPGASWLNDNGKTLLYAGAGLLGLVVILRVLR